MAELTLKQIEETLKKVDQGNPFYPRYLGDGLFEVIPGVIGGERFMEEVNNAIFEELRKENNHGIPQ